MGKKYKDLFQLITSEENIYDAFRKTSLGKRNTNSYLEFELNSEINLHNIRAELLSGEYEQGQHRHFYVYEPKKRLISALPFKDRIVQHAINNVIEPIFDSTFLPYSFACRRGYGAHKGVVYVQSQMRKNKFKYCLKTDFSKYFPNIRTDIIWRQINKKISCQPTIELLEKIIPPNTIGLPIGNLLSQLMANVFGSVVDYHIHHNIVPTCWARYMDDIVIFGNCLDDLRSAKEDLENFSLSVGQSFSKWSITKTSQGVNFLGYRIWNHHKLLRKRSVLDAKRKINNMEARGETDQLSKFLASWKGHAQWADCHNLYKHLENKHANLYQQSQRP